MIGNYVFMSSSKKSIGIPIKLIHEAEKHLVSIELQNGDFIKGELFNSEDNWNLHIKNAVIFSNKHQYRISHIFIRGNQIRYLIVPEVLKNSPMFKTINPSNKLVNIPSGVGILGKAGIADSVVKSETWR